MLKLIGITLSCADVQSCAIFFAKIFDVEATRTAQNATEEVQLQLGGVCLHLLSLPPANDILSSNPLNCFQLQLPENENLEDFCKKIEFFFYTHPHLGQQVAAPQLMQKNGHLVLRFQDPSLHHWEVTPSSQES